MESIDFRSEAGDAEWVSSLADLLCEEYICLEALLALLLEEEEAFRSKSTASLREVRTKKQNILHSIQLFEARIGSLRQRWNDWNERGKPHGLCGASVAEYARRNRGILSRIVAVGEELASIETTRIPGRSRKF